MIQAKKLAKQFQGKPVLYELDLWVNPGELVVLQGANGAGKTTLIRILATLTRPASGDFFIGGVSGRKEAQQVRKQIGVMLHQPMLYGDLTAMENLRFYAALAGLKNYQKQCELHLEQVGLDATNSKLVRNYSRGMQQRLSIARALIGDPAVLLLDEPFTGLDSAHQEQLLALLVDLKARGKTILMADHDPYRAQKIASRVDYLFRGSICCSFSGERLEPSRLSASINEIESNHTPAVIAARPGAV